MPNVSVSGLMATSWNYDGSRSIRILKVLALNINLGKPTTSTWLQRIRGFQKIYNQCNSKYLINHDYNTHRNNPQLSSGLIISSLNSLPSEQRLRGDTESVLGKAGTVEFGNRSL